MMYTNFLKKFMPFSIIISLILVGLGTLDAYKPVMSFAWICFAVFCIAGLLIFYFSIQTINGKLNNFMSVYFAGIIGKLIIIGTIVLIYKTNHETSSINYIVPFAIIYFAFLFFETIELVKLSNKHK